MPDLPAVSRRSALRLLALGAVGVVAGCRRAQPQASSATTATGTSRTAVPPSATGAPTRTIAPAPASPTTDPTAEAAARNERALIAAYDDAVRYLQFSRNDLAWSAGRANTRKQTSLGVFDLKPGTPDRRPSRS